LETPNKLH
jgi:NADH:ubiquinone oxidoreductase subunit B-like Fe-S oxidoreductase